MRRQKARRRHQNMSTKSEKAAPQLPLQPTRQAALLLRIDPPLLTPWMGEKDRNRNVLLLDLDADMDTEGATIIDLDVAFNARPIPCGVMRTVDFYVGSTGALISVTAIKGSITSHTGPATLGVKYANSRTTKRNTSVSFSPKLKATQGHSQQEVSGFAINRDVSDAFSFKAEFASEERYLATKRFDDSIEWSIQMPRGEKIVRDYLFGNLYLSATC